MLDNVYTYKLIAFDWTKYLKNKHKILILTDGDHVKTTIEAIWFNTYHMVIIREWEERSIWLLL